MGVLENAKCNKCNVMFKKRAVMLTALFLYILVGLPSQISLLIYYDVVVLQKRRGNTLLQEVCAFSSFLRRR